MAVVKRVDELGVRPESLTPPLSATQVAALTQGGLRTDARGATLFLDPAKGLNLDDNRKHRAIYDCIKAGDGKGAAEALRLTLSDSAAGIQRLEAESRAPYYPPQEPVALCGEAK